VGVRETVDFESREVSSADDNERELKEVAKRAADSDDSLKPAAN
jgi:hypothetical protein